LGLLEHGDDLAVGKAGLLHGTSSGKGTRKFHFWRLLMGGGITDPVPQKNTVNVDILDVSRISGGWVVVLIYVWITGLVHYGGMRVNS
ncbi:hypothetical protein QUT15_17485, partial [Xanthomonas citri pv. citri]